MLIRRKPGQAELNQETQEMIWQTIFVHLEPYELMRVAQVDKYHYYFVNNLMWRIKVQQHFSEEYHANKDKNDVKWHNVFMTSFIAEYPDKSVSSIAEKLSLFNWANEGNWQALTQRGVKSEMMLTTTNKNQQSLIDRAAYNATMFSNFEFDNTKYKTLLYHYYNEALKKDMVVTDLPFLSIVEIKNAILFSQPIDTIKSILSKEGKPESILLALEPQIFPLHVAIKHANVEMLVFLIENGANINLQNDDGDTPLHLAIKSGNEKLINTLLAYINKINIYLKNNDFMTVLMTSTDKDQSHIIEKLLLKISQTTDDIGRFVNTTDNAGRTALHYAAAKGNTLAMQTLIDSSAPYIEINAKDADGLTPLMYAAKYGKTETLEAMINGLYGIDITAKDTKGWNALMHAAVEGHLDTLETLNRKLTIIKDSKSLNMLRLLATQNYDEAMSLAISLKDNTVVDYIKPTLLPTNSVFESLQQAIVADNIYAIDALLNCLDLNTQDNLKNTILMFAVSYAHLHTINYLLNQDNIDVNLKNDNGKTALDIAWFRLNLEDTKSALYANRYKTFISILTHKKTIIDYKNEENVNMLKFAYQQSNELKNILKTKLATLYNKYHHYTEGTNYTKKQKIVEYLFNVINGVNDKKCPSYLSGNQGLFKLPGKNDKKSKTLINIYNIIKP